MPIKIFSAPGDHRDDFAKVEAQVNEWEAEAKPHIIGMHCTMHEAAGMRDAGGFVLTIVIQYERSGAPSA
jgi:hypothetical protein